MAIDILTLALAKKMSGASGGGAVQSDWSQNDETALDYVKNRTHWTETTVGQKTEAIYLDCLNSSGGSKIVSVSQSFIDGLMTSPDSVIVCKDVSADSLEQTHKIVVIDDTTFGFVRLSDNRTEYLKGYIGKNSSGEPTVYVTDGGGNWGHCNIAVTYDVEVEKIHTLDPKYLPDSAAHIETGAEVGQTIVVKAVDENGKPTEWETADLLQGGGSEWELLGEYTMLVKDKEMNIDLSQYNARYFRIIGKFPKCTADSGMLYAYLGTWFNQVNPKYNQNVYAVNLLAECELVDGQLYGYIGFADGWQYNSGAIATVINTPRDTEKNTTLKIYYANLVDDATENTIKVYGRK